MRSAMAPYVVRPAPVGNASTTSASAYTVRIRSKIVPTVSGWVPIKPCMSVLHLCGQSEAEHEQRRVTRHPRVEAGEVAHPAEPVRDRVHVHVLGTSCLRDRPGREV